MELKKCSRCTIEKSLNDFYKDGRYSGGYTKQFNEMLEKQDGKCAICEAAMTKPVVDHCHSTGRIRGILCAKCNRHMAAIDESGFMEKAMRYINAL